MALETESPLTTSKILLNVEGRDFAVSISSNLTLLPYAETKLFKNFQLMSKLTQGSNSMVNKRMANIEKTIPAIQGPDKLQNTLLQIEQRFF